MRFVNWLLGWAELHVTGACPQELLNRCAERGLGFYAVECPDELTLRLRTAIRDTPEVALLGEGCCCEVEILHLRGAPMMLHSLRSRAVLMIAALLTAICVGAASFFVWDIDIEGADPAFETKIRQVLAQCGAGYGSFWPGFEADMLRSQALLQLPELKWLGLQVKGSHLTVQVRMAQEIPELFQPETPVTVVAMKSGIIEKLGALRGSARLKTGDTVLEGETIIDGVVVSTFDGRVRLVHATGSVLARVWYEISAVMPLESEEKLPVGRERKQYSLILGGKRINFYRSSRILEGECDIITKKYTLGSQGVFSLPVALVCTTAQEYETLNTPRPEQQLREALTKALEEELQKRLCPTDSVTEKTLAFSRSGEFAVATLRAECLQEIAEEAELSPEEIEKATGKEETAE